MDEVEIHEIHSQILETSIDGCKRFIEAMIVVPQLSGDKDFVSG
jgi:hypothetical protein